jgi:hypothetical protein
MNEDAVVEEVHRIREQILAEYQDDLRLLISDARRRTDEAARSGKSIVTREGAPAPKPAGNRKAG